MSDQSYGSGEFAGPLTGTDTAGALPAVVGAPAAAATVSADGAAAGALPAAVGATAAAAHARPTAAQQARAEGRSPVIEPGAVPAALTAVLGLLLAGAAATGRYALLAPLVVLQGVTAAGWFRLNGMWPARQGIALAFLGALAADGALLGAGREQAPAALLGVLGGWVLLGVVSQLRSRASADERIQGLMATVTSAALAVAAAGHLAAGREAAEIGGLAVASAVLVRAVPLPAAPSALLALAAAGGAGYGLTHVTHLTGYGAQDAALLALGAGLCALIGHRVASYDYPSRFVHMTAGVALPLALAAPVVYVLGRALG